MLIIKYPLNHQANQDSSLDIKIRESNPINKNLMIYSKKMLVGH